MEPSKLQEAAEVLDQLCNTDITGRRVITTLFGAARAMADAPLTYSAAHRLLDRIYPGDTVLITTGWVDQPLVAPGYGETDGPPGAAALARALRLALKAIPIIVVDECLVPGMKQVAQAAGFHCVSPDVLHHSIEQNKLLTLSVLPFPHNHDTAKLQAAGLLDRYKPKSCIAIECGGMNDAGRIHNMAGFATDNCQAKFDYLFREAKKRNILTLAIGDGGNEIGMANIADTIRSSIPYAEKCQCPCGQGFAPSTIVDVLVTSTVSNWGAYAISALLGASTGVISALNTPEREAHVLTAAASAGFHDAIYGSVAPSADGCTLDVHTSMVRLMQEVILRRQV